MNDPTFPRASDNPAVPALLGVANETDPIADAIKRWSPVTEPIRPSREEMSFYEKHLTAGNPTPEKSALILGSTPELRSVALKYHLKSTGCDVDEHFWKAMSTFRDVEGEERFIHANWLDLPMDCQYDFILADGALNMLTWHEMQSLVPKLCAILRSDGVSIQRIQTANASLTMDSLRNAIAAYEGERVGLPFLLSMHFLIESLRNTDRPEMTYREFFEAIVASYLTPEEFSRLRPLIVNRTGRSCYPYLEDMTALLEQHFDIVDAEVCVGKYVWGTERMFVLKRKRN